ncbi:MAG: hypothetical protein DRJ02_12465 [Bacteroidetes bacterium]|nr:MAG: hypothetical protein DRJ02_12465 [Bacteroidota bacterium]
MLYSKETYKLQQEFTRWCRTGEEIHLENTRPEGLKQYRRLLRNNINNTMKQAFPIAVSILSEKEWATLIDDFFAGHDAQTFQVWKLPFEFYQFVSKQSYGITFKKPYLSDLLHFEWIEIDVHTMPDQIPEPFKKKGDPKKDRIEVNKEYRLIKLNFPVHLYAAEESKNHTGNYFLLAYRHPDNFEVRFVDLPALHTLFFEKIAQEGKSVQEILKEIGEASSPELMPEIEKNISKFVETMFDQKIFLGYQHIYKN